MKVTNEKTENSQAFLAIEMEPAEVEEYLEKSYRRLVRRAKVPGFREGKAPRAILERYLGKDRLFEDALNDLLPEAYGKAVKEQAIEPIARPQIEVTQTEPLVFKAVVPLKPKVKLGDYQHMQVAPEPVEAVTEEQINAVVEELRHRHATWEPAERPVAFNDLLVMDIWSNVENKPFINRKGIQYQVLEGLSFPAPGFAEQIVGLKNDEEKEFKLQFPPDYPRSELAGKEASFKVRINEIKQEVLPEVNDEFARVVNPDFKTLDSLREGVSSDLKLRAEEKSRIDFQEKVMDSTVGVAELEFPPVLVDVEINRMLDRSFQGGHQEMETYLRSIKKTEEQLHEELRPQATRNVTRSLVLGKVAEEEKIEVSDAEIDADIENMKKSSTDKKDELEKILDTPQARESIRETLLARKTVQRLVDIAKGSTEVEATQKEGEK